MCAAAGRQTPQVNLALPGAPGNAAKPHACAAVPAPSRYCQSDLLGDLAAQITEGLTPGYDQVEAIRAWIHDDITYGYGTSNASTDARETAEQREGRR